MCATRFRRPAGRRRGLALAAALALTLVLGSFSLLLITAATSQTRNTKTRLDRTKAFHVAEGGLDYCVSQFNEDLLWPVRDATAFPNVDASGAFLSRGYPLGRTGGSFDVRVSYQTQNKLPRTWTSSGFPTGWEPTSPVVISDRSDPNPPRFDCILVEVTGRAGGAQRKVRADVRFKYTLYSSAIVSDAVSSGGTGSGKGFAIDKKVIVMDGLNQYVHGGIRSNGGIYLGGSSVPLTTQNAPALLDAFTGSVFSNLAGTGQEIPDYTAPGSATQLFEFARFRAAAVAGRGSLHTSIAGFATAMNAANAAGTPLEGVVFLEIDCATAGNNPKITTSLIPGGINVRGTLVMSFKNAPDTFYKVFMETPVRINAATLPANFDPDNSATFATGYPPVLDPAKDPHGFDLTPWGYPGFPVECDLPALMFDNGTVDLHHETNICGMVYGPSFIEIENKHDELQYFSGVVVGGAGIYLNGATGAGAAQVFAFDMNTVDELATYNDQGKTPIINRFMVGK